MGTATSPTLVTEMDLPVIDPRLFEMPHEEVLAAMTKLADDTWIARSLFGYSILSYADVTAVLRDKRWHNAASKIPEMRGITDPELIGNRDKPSILAAEGDVHTRLRRLVAKAFSPRSADRLRPFMREVMNGLIDPVAASGTADIVADITEPYPIPIICELLGA
ncbi:MAG: cytochrome P450, partial [Minisyncoccia bacterium]